MAELRTKRIKLAEVLVCAGCCCGHVEKGHPEVPVAWLKEEWRRRGLLKSIQLTIAGCIGPCDLPNVVCITTGHGSTWVGNIDGNDDYQALLAWAVQSKTAGALAPLPREFRDKLFSPFETQAKGCAIECWQAK